MVCDGFAGDRRVGSCERKESLGILSRLFASLVSLANPRDENRAELFVFLPQIEPVIHLERILSERGYASCALEVADSFNRACICAFCIPDESGWLETIIFMKINLFVVFFDF